MPHTQQHTLIRRAIQDVWNDGRIDKADEFFALDYVNHGGLIPDLVYGPEAIRISVILYRRAFPRLYISVDELRKDGEVFILKWTARNKRVFRLPRVTFKTDPPDQLAGHIQIRIADGKIAESWMSLSEDSLKAIIPSSLAA